MLAGSSQSPPARTLIEADPVDTGVKENRRGSQSTDSSSGSRRRRPHAPTEWAKLQSTIEHLYINLDMPLRDVVLVIEKQHGFYATEQMYKKRMRTWGLVKHVKSETKDQQIAKILDNPSDSVDPIPIRVDKLVRYAKSRAKDGNLDSVNLTRILKSKKDQTGKFKHVAPLQPFDNSRLKLKRQLVPSRSLQFPSDQAEFDLFLRAMQVLIVKERQEWLMGQQVMPSSILDALTSGIACWRRNEFPSAWKFFGVASQAVTQDLEGDISVSRICYCISSLLWGSQREPVFQIFAQFMADAARDILGQGSPLAIVLRQLQSEKSLDAQLAIWDCALSTNQISRQNFDHWWSMAQRRWRWCNRGGMTTKAVTYRDQALREARNFEKLTNDMELEAQTDFEVISSGAG